MSTTSTPPTTAIQTQNPTPHHAPKSEIQTDCLPCRIVGATTFSGLGIYVYISGMSQLRAEAQSAIPHPNLHPSHSPKSARNIIGRIASSALLNKSSGSGSGSGALKTFRIRVLGVRILAAALVGVGGWRMVF